MDVSCTQHGGGGRPACLGWYAAKQATIAPELSVRFSERPRHLPGEVLAHGQPRAAPQTHTHEYMLQLQAWQPHKFKIPLQMNCV